MDKLRTQSIAAAVTAASTVVVEAANARHAIILCAPVAGRYSVQFGGPAVLDAGITMIAGASPLKLTRDEIGDDILAGMQVIGSGVFTVGIMVVNGNCCRREYE